MPKLKATIEITYTPNPKCYVKGIDTIEKQLEEDQKFLQEHPTEFFVFATDIDGIEADVEIVEDEDLIQGEDDGGG